LPQFVLKFPHIRRYILFSGPVQNNILCVIPKKTVASHEFPWHPLFIG